MGRAAIGGNRVGERGDEGNAGILPGRRGRNGPIFDSRGTGAVFGVPASGERANRIDVRGGVWNRGEAEGDIGETWNRRVAEPNSEVCVGEFAFIHRKREPKSVLVSIPDRFVGARHAARRNLDAEQRVVPIVSLREAGNRGQMGRLRARNQPAHPRNQRRTAVLRRAAARQDSAVRGGPDRGIGETAYSGNGPLEASAGQKRADEQPNARNPQPIEPDHPQSRGKPPRGGGRMRPSRSLGGNGEGSARQGGGNRGNGSEIHQSDLDGKPPIFGIHDGTSHHRRAERRSTGVASGVRRSGDFGGVLGADE